VDQRQLRRLWSLFNSVRNR